MFQDFLGSEIILEKENSGESGKIIENDESIVVGTEARVVLRAEHVHVKNFEWPCHG